MRTFVYFLLALILLILIIGYALLVMVHEADERAKRMYRAWKESKDNDNDRRN